MEEFLGRMALIRKCDSHAARDGDTDRLHSALFIAAMQADSDARGDGNGQDALRPEVVWAVGHAGVVGTG